MVVKHAFKERRVLKTLVALLSVREVPRIGIEASVRRLSSDLIRLMAGGNAEEDTEDEEYEEDNNSSSDDTSSSDEDAQTSFYQITHGVLKKLYNKEGKYKK